MDSPPETREAAPRQGKAAPLTKSQRQDATPAAIGKPQFAPQRLEVRAPAFQFYPSDFLSDMRIRMLSWASRGLYIDLLCYCWREGWIPSDSSAIAQLCHCHDTAIIEPCLALFSPHPTDPEKLIHLALDAEREKQKAFREERKASGIKGAAKRWKPDSSAIKELIAKNGSSSSIFSLLSSDVPPTPKGGKARVIFQKPTLEEIAEFGKTLNPPFTEAEELFDHYTANGWKVGKVQMIDWQAAVRNWSRRNMNQTGKSAAPSPAGTVIVNGRAFRS